MHDALTLRQLTLCRVLRQATSAVNKESDVETACRVGIGASLDLLNYVKCGTVVKLCAFIADEGGQSQQIIERVADRIESMAKENREFAGLVASWCAKIIGNHTVLTLLPLFSRVANS